MYFTFADFVSAYSIANKIQLLNVFIYGSALVILVTKNTP